MLHSPEMSFPFVEKKKVISLCKKEIEMLFKSNLRTMTWEQHLTKLQEWFCLLGFKSQLHMFFETEGCIFV